MSNGNTHQYINNIFSDIPDDNVNQKEYKNTHPFKADGKSKNKQFDNIIFILSIAIIAIAVGTVFTVTYLLTSRNRSNNVTSKSIPTTTSRVVSTYSTTKKSGTVPTSTTAHSTPAIKSELRLPKLSLPGGEYNKIILLKFIDIQPGTVIYYSTDGSIPTRYSKKYDYRGIWLGEGTTVIRAISVNMDGESSDETIEIYKIVLPEVQDSDSMTTEPTQKSSETVFFIKYFVGALRNIRANTSFSDEFKRNSEYLIKTIFAVNLTIILHSLIDIDMEYPIIHILLWMNIIFLSLISGNVNLKINMRKSFKIASELLIIEIAAILIPIAVSYTLYSYGVYKYNKGEYEKAIKCFAVCDKVLPAFPQAFHVSADAYYRIFYTKDDTECLYKSIEYYSKVETMNKYDRNIPYKLSQIYIYQGNYKKLKNNCIS